MPEPRIRRTKPPEKLRNRKVRLCLTQWEEDDLQARADVLDMSISEFVRDKLWPRRREEN